MSTARTTVAAVDAALPAPGILRYTFAERINHWLSSASYVYLLLSGLAFWSPSLFWITLFLGGAQAARFWHPWLGLLFAFSTILMYFSWHSDMRTTAADIEWKDSIQHYIRNEDELMPAAGRFNYGQKLFYWVMLWATLALVLSGVGLWFVESIPWSLRWLRYAAILIHVGAALVTIGAMIIHVYMGTALVRGSFDGMVRGVVPASWARTHHRLWYNQVTGRSDRPTRPAR